MTEGTGQYTLPLDWFLSRWLDRRPNLHPYASDNPKTEGLYRMPRERALTKRLIQANPTDLFNVLVADGDDSDSALRAQQASVNQHPMPNGIIENPRNGHAHPFWVLGEPVTKTEYAHRKPLRFWEDVSEGLRRAVNGDKSYAGLLMKNPDHPAWIFHFHRAEPYTLRELETELRRGGWMPPPRWKQSKTYVPQGLGRNRTLFDTARKWAYAEVRHHFGDPVGLGNAIFARAEEINNEFFNVHGEPDPLPDSEVRSVARSITKWIINESRMWRDGPVVYAATWETLQAARRRNGGLKSSEIRRNAAAEKRAAIEAMRIPLWTPGSPVGPADTPSS